QRGEIGVAFVKAAPLAHFQAVPLVADQVDRHSHRQVAAHGRIERHQHALDRVRQRRGARDHALDDGFAVLGFARLQVGRVGADLDEIALGVDAEQARAFRADLPADNERGVEADLVFLKIRAVAQLDVAHRVRDQPRDVEHGLRAPQASAGIAALVQYADHGLGARQVAGAEQDDDAVALALVHRHLAELGEIVDAGVGARIRGENNALVEQYTDAIGHASRSNLSEAFIFSGIPAALRALTHTGREL